MGERVRDNLVVLQCSCMWQYFKYFLFFVSPAAAGSEAGGDERDAGAGSEVAGG